MLLFHQSSQGRNSQTEVCTKSDRRLVKTLKNSTPLVLFGRSMSSWHVSGSLHEHLSPFKKNRRPTECLLLFTETNHVYVTRYRSISVCLEQKAFPCSQVLPAGLGTRYSGREEFVVLFFFCSSLAGCKFILML